ncbi:MAG: ribosome biogenesis GTPase Der [Defluviitaleaceae bacterium]|nr:ribosome biogenesis GTPase Der [Defluviitaleaceae bacterium]MCL2837038.1 ribosome biogenesis GTPase Der [Defluviitaleaceae bacterium]
MSKPIVAVVGRPNVGKSTLFNKLARRRISIVEDEPGVTRDRIYADAEWQRHKFTLVDTGGLDPDSDDIFFTNMMNQAMVAMETADVILFIADVKTGVIEADVKVADILRRTKKPVVLAVNKADDMLRGEIEAYEFYALGLGEPIAISAGQMLGLGDLLDAVTAHFPPDEAGDAGDETIKVAIVGKPNVGKSSLLNRLLGEERSIVSDIPGTTRDAVDAFIERDGQRYLFIDTAGIRKKSRIKENIERYSIVRALAAIERCDVCVLVIDAVEGVSEQDSKIAGIAHDRGKAAVIVTNKWDAIEKDGKTMKSYLSRIELELGFMPYAPKLFISAVTGQRVEQLCEAVYAVSQNHSRRVQTGILNDTLIEAMAVTPPPSDRGRALRVYYITQVSVKPPTFVLFVNDQELMHYSYQRFIENKLRQAFGFSGTPIRFIIRNKEKDKS